QKNFSKRVYQALFYKKDVDFLRAVQDELELVMLQLAKKLQQAPDSEQERLCEMLVSSILSIYPFLEPLPQMLKVAQKINGEWKLVCYDVERLALTPERLSSPMTAFGLTAKDAQALLLFMGTPQPTASGSFLSVWTDLVPGMMVGELAFHLFAKS